MKQSEINLMIIVNSVCITTCFALERPEAMKDLNLPLSIVNKLPDLEKTLKDHLSDERILSKLVFFVRDEVQNMIKEKYGEQT